MSKIKIFITWFSIFFSLFCLSAKKVSAKVVINEVYPQPESGETEWIELFNTGQESVDLASWSLWDQLSSPSMINIFTEQVVGAGEYLVIEVSQLNNTADGVTLKDQDGQVIDEMRYNQSQAKKSWARSPNASGQFELGIPSKGSENPTLVATPIPTPSPTPSHPSPQPSPSVPSYPPSIELSEIMSCPESGTEWLEVYNPYPDKFDLANWSVIDAKGTVKTVSFNLEPNSFGVISWAGSLLNNDGDSVRLENPSGKVYFDVTFPECSKGSSFIFHQDKLQETITPTKGKENTLKVINQDPSEPTSTAIKLDTNQVTKTPTQSAHLAIQENKVVVSRKFKPQDLVNPKLVASESSKSSSVLGLSRNHPSGESRDPPSSLPGVLGVIMGGCLLTGVGGHGLYESAIKSSSSALP